MLKCWRKLKVMPRGELQIGLVRDVAGRQDLVNVMSRSAKGSAMSRSRKAIKSLDILDSSVSVWMLQSQRRNKCFLVNIYIWRVNITNQLGTLCCITLALAHLYIPQPEPSVCTTNTKLSSFRIS